MSQAYRNQAESGVEIRLKNRRVRVCRTRAGEFLLAWTQLVDRIPYVTRVRLSAEAAAATAVCLVEAADLPAGKKARKDLRHPSPAGLAPVETKKELQP